MSVQAVQAACTVASYHLRRHHGLRVHRRLLQLANAAVKLLLQLPQAYVMLLKWARRCVHGSSLQSFDLSFRATGRLGFGINHCQSQLSSPHQQLNAPGTPRSCLGGAHSLVEPGNIPPAMLLRMRTTAVSVATRGSPHSRVLASVLQPPPVRKSSASAQQRQLRFFKGTCPLASHACCPPRRPCAKLPCAKLPCAAAPQLSQGHCVTRR